jgi:hypothetical protein
MSTVGRVNPKPNWLAIASVAISSLGIVGALLGTWGVREMPQGDPQGWDKLGWLLAVHGVSLLVALLGAIAGVAALLRHRPLGIGTQALAIAGITLALLDVAIAGWVFY